MDEVIRLLAIGGDVGIWVIVAIIWRFNNRIQFLEITMESHIVQSKIDHKRIEDALKVQ
jgi:hypothetical protein